MKSRSYHYDVYAFPPSQHLTSMHFLFPPPLPPLYLFLFPFLYPPYKVPSLSKSSGKSLGITANSPGPKPISVKISCRRGLLEARINVALLLKLVK